eukprot:NODE_1275_length_1801_cov_64.136472_g1210_i0.p1 GENE.NODE_1275_length_1801_cov_64.136472_g1210_i0~~NODE_1275_length_1801_cov_64.136472_g1210_i0.p1  ORF type:complete len:542 (-),score=47.54 NODE_1275_length_1801_cov_64.136472_g1210_i0:175-1740(-)
MSQPGGGWASWLFYAADPCALGVLRWLFGTILVVELTQKLLMSQGDPTLKTYEDYNGMRFRLEPLPLVPMLEGVWLRVHVWIMVFCAFTMLLGWWYRLSVFVLIIAYGWYALWDMAYYTDQHYLVFMMLCAFLVTDANNFGVISSRLISIPEAPNVDWKGFSKDPLRWYHARAPASTLNNVFRPHPAWHLVLFRVMCIAPYIFGFLNKLNADWLSGVTTGIWVRSLVGNAQSHTFVSIIVAWIALIAEGFIGAGLLAPQGGAFRILAIILGVAYQLVQTILAPASRMSLFLAASTLVFADSDQVRILFYVIASSSRSFLNYICAVAPPYCDQLHAPSGGKPLRWKLAPAGPIRRAMVFLLLAVWVGINFGLPLRTHIVHWSTPHTQRWTNRGTQFAWHEWITVRECTGSFSVINTVSKAEFVAKTTRNGARIVTTDPVDLSRGQLRARLENPSFVRQYAHFLADFYSDHWNDGAKVAVYASVNCSIDGKNMFPFINASTDLAALQYPGPFAMEPFVLAKHA